MYRDNAGLRSRLPRAAYSSPLSFAPFCRIVSSKYRVCVLPQESISPSRRSSASCSHKTPTQSDKGYNLYWNRGQVVQQTPCVFKSFRTSAIRISVCDFETLIEQSDAQSGCAISCAQSCTRMQRFSAIATSSLSTMTSEI